MVSLREEQTGVRQLEDEVPRGEAGGKKQPATVKMRTMRRRMKLPGNERRGM